MITGVDHTGISVGFICHDGGGNFLFHKRSKNTRDQNGRWDWGGGKLEYGETIKTALLRELKEEYGCAGEIEMALPPVDYFNAEGKNKTHWVILTYIVKVSRGEVKNNEPRSIDEIGWFTLDNLPQPLHTGVAEDIGIFREYLEKFSR